MGSCTRDILADTLYFADTVRTHIGPILISVADLGLGCVRAPECANWKSEMETQCVLVHIPAPHTSECQTFMS
jgi:hypothetical protein